MSSFLARRAVAAPRIARAFSTTPARPVAKITIVGNLAGPPELQATSTGREILKYAVASNQGRGENAKTSWFRVTAFEDEGPRRDYFQSLPKGTLVYLEGEASISTYDDEGKTRSSLSIVQRNLEVLRRPASAGPEESSR
ncbi:nucleic acid-binding protein [Cryphonectria parasitica EP155]|uniref:Nucleic acid-binding protein n=1 Tax=Cryphonectria parasitica (strain ATCC 38755 / EP155) TaxID=660469 RepID=A0A9P4YBJ3_CRYP1|nr:nucleic acid-binding protein [Cryphonectria parasitica EP155]KAF3770033.1 nucleic acid-binding protein [Cryphonectria parasitica EP155]